MSSQRKEESMENTCVVCFKEVEIYSIGQCDHPVCFECSTRMRVLCRQNECPICRQEMPTVIFTKAIRPFESIKAGNFVSDSKYKIFFSSDNEKLAYENLLTHVCPQCGKVSPNFGHLRDHVRRVHMLIYCDLCVDHLKILTRERRCYNRKDLATHRKVGDPDDRSHRGHPLCEFCDKRYMDNDELYKHLRRDHFYCHFCDADGLHYYYKTYDSLREHFRSDHYLCEEGDCYVEKFTSVFRSDIDLKAHKASAHGKVLGKAALKQARTLDIAFTLAPRPRPQRQNRHHNSNNQPPQVGASSAAPREEEWETGAIGGATDEPPPEVEKPPQPPVAQLNTNCIEEFPTLRGGSAAPPPSITTSGGSRKTVSASLRPQGQFSAEDFPALGPETTSPAPVTSVTMRVNTERPSSSSNAPQQTNLSIQVSSPRFTTTVTSKKTYNLHFPALDENREPPVVSSSATVQWTAKKKTQKESQTPSFQPSTVAAHISKSKPVPKMDDFPALEPKSNKPLFPKTAPKINAAPTASTKMTSIQDQFAQTKSKKKKSKSKNTSSGGTNSADNKKKSGVESGSGEPASETKKTSSAYEKRAQLLDGMVETEPSEVRATPQSLNLMSEEELILLMRGNVNEKENRRETANKPLRIDEGSFPALPGFGPPPGFEAKWEAKTSVRKPKMPPPGLVGPSQTNEKSRGPPPGLDANFSSPPPPGFSPVNGSFPPLSTDIGYILPPSFDRRNTTLVDKIAKALGADALNDFKQISFAFRSSMLGSAEYYNYCKDTMGDDSFVGIFPELLALLPEIGKQQELWPHYKSDKDRFEASTTKGNRLDACATCGQVLRYGDLKDHLSRHSLDNHFPSLEGKKQPPKSSWSK